MVLLILLSFAFWSVVTPLLKHLFQLVLSACCSRPISPTAAWIPSQLPHPNPPGSAVLFDIALTSATDQQIIAFMKYRGRKWDRNEDGAIGLRAVVAEAAAYKGELYEERTMKWIDDHFRLKLPSLAYPYVAPHWNGWSSFWLETGPCIRSMFVASLFLTFEHVLGGIVLPALYLATENPVYFDITMYSEIGMQVVLSVAIAISYIIGEDRTVEQMHRAVWPLLLIHHVCTIGFCILCLRLGDDCPREEVSYILFAMLGFTSSLHYISQMLDFSPFSQSNAPRIRIVNHALCLAAQLWFRGVFYFKIVHDYCWKLHAARGPYVASVSILVSLLFTAFNFDFIKFHVKATKGCWRKMQQAAAHSQKTD